VDVRVADIVAGLLGLPAHFAHRHVRFSPLRFTGYSLSSLCESGTPVFSAGPRISLIHAA